ncbi:hypothetical protein [Terriglobus roseus]|nr:hypothetical protein [Terriglobus roseus]
MTSTNWQIVRWWEYRRLPFNAALLCVGLLSIGVFEWLMDKVIPRGEDAVEPMVLILGIGLYGLTANLCYTLGWVYELRSQSSPSARERHKAKRLFRDGLLASCVLTSAPLWFGFLYYLTHPRLNQ